MDQDKFYELIIEIKSKLSSIDTKVDSLIQRIENHENRISTLEQNPVEKKDWKTDLIMLMMKALTISVIAIGSLAGASGLIKQILIGG